MLDPPHGSPSGHVFRVERKRGPAWYAKYRLADGRQVQRKIGPAWTGRGRPAAGFVTKRLAEDWLYEILAQARRGTLPGAVRTGATFEDAVAEWLRYVEHDRDCKPSTLTHYRSTVNAHLRQEFAGMRIEDITTRQIEAWRARIGQGRERPIGNRTRNNAVSILHGILERARKVFGLPHNPAADIEPLRERYDATRFAFYSPEEVLALARAAASEQDSAIFLTAAYTGLRRGELIALRWRAWTSPVTPSGCGQATPTELSRCRSPARAARCRWSPRSPRCSPDWASGITTRARMTSSFPGSAAPIWTAAHCAGAI